MLFTVYQRAETSETFMFDATANTNVEISICNKAGCSNPTSTVCLYAQAQNENSGGKKIRFLAFVFYDCFEIAFVLFNIFPQRQ